MQSIVKHTARRVVALAAALCLWHGAAWAATHSVSTVAQLTAAVNNNAVSGDVINVAAGTYSLSASGYCSFALSLKSGVSLVGSGAAQTKLIFSGQGRLLEVKGGVDTAHIKGIAIEVTTNCWNSGGAVYADGANVKLLLENCDITGKIGLSGGAVNVSNYAFVKVVGSDIHNCTAQSGSAFNVNNATLHLYDSKVHDNNAGETGGAFYLANGGHISAVRTNIYNNTTVSGQGNGGAGYLTGNSTMALEYCSILNNSSTGGGAGFFLQGFNTLTMAYCTMAGNNNVGWGSGGVSAGDPCEIDISNSVVTGNSTNSPLGDDLPNNVTVSIEGSVVGDQLVVSNDTTASCHPNCSYTIPNADSIIQKDENGQVVVGDNGQVNVNLPDTLTTPGGESVPITEIPEIPIEIDTVTGKPNAPIGQGGNEQGSNDGGQPASLQLSLVDSLVCVEQVATFRVRAVGHGGLMDYRLIRVLQGTTEVVEAKGNVVGSATFAYIPNAAAVEQYRVEAYKNGNLRSTSNEVRLIVVPLATSGKIDHSRNVDN